MFRICSGKGFQVVFENGYTVSVQFGGGNYCDNYNDHISPQAWVASGEKGSADAECAVIFQGKLLELEGWGDSVKGRMSPKEVLGLLVWAESQLKEESNVE